MFQGRYKARLVDRASYLLELSGYLHLNPVCAIMVERPEEYPHSSYAAYIADNNGIVRTTELFTMFSENTKVAQQKYKVFVESVMGEKQESPMKKAEN